MPYKAYQSVKTEDASADGQMEASDSTNGEGTKNQAPWLNRVKSGAVKKLPKDVLKRRRNYKLKKIISPKAPSMVLNEVLGTMGVKYETSEVIPMTRMIRIKAEYDGETFEGLGPSKSIAKNNCAEKILMHIVLKSGSKKDDSAEKVKDEAMDHTEDGDVGGDPSSEEVKEFQKEENMPWTALACLGLFKLFSEWQANGAELPEELNKSLRNCTVAMPLGMPEMGMRMPMMGRGMPAMAPGMMPGMGPGCLPGMPMMGMGMPMAVSVQGKKKKDSRSRPKADGERKEKELPENPTLRHPVQLLNEMVGALSYNQTMEGEAPEAICVTTVEVKGQMFTGRVPNAGDIKSAKKASKKVAAEAALQALYNVVYPQSAY